MKKFIRFLFVEWNEFLSIPLGLLLFFGFPYVLRFIDSTSAAYDGGVLHSYVAAIAGMLLIHGFAWLLLKITFPKIYSFFDNMFEEHIVKQGSFLPTLTDREKFLNLSVWQKCVLALSYFSLLLLGTVLLAKIF
jgi:hypothetical protein